MQRITHPTRSLARNATTPPDDAIGAVLPRDPIDSVPSPVAFGRCMDSILVRRGNRNDEWLSGVSKCNSDDAKGVGTL